MERDLKELSDKVDKQAIQLVRIETMLSSHFKNLDENGCRAGKKRFEKHDGREKGLVAVAAGLGGALGWLLSFLKK